MAQQENVPVPRVRTANAAWMGAGASLLLHLSVAAAVVGGLPGPVHHAPLVIDLTLAEPAGDLPATDPGSKAAHLGRSSVPVAVPRSDGPPPVSPPAPDISGVPIHAVRPPDPAPPPSGTTSGESGPIAATTPSLPIAPFSPSSPAGSAPGSPQSPAATAAGASGEGTGRKTAGTAAGNGSPGFLPGEYGRIRDAIQRAIAYPATARRMGWEGKVVVAFQLLSDGSVRDVRVVQGSGHATLDRGAIDAVRNASPFPRSSVEAEVVTPVVYRLTLR